MKKLTKAQKEYIKMMLEIAESHSLGRGYMKCEDQKRR